MDESSSMDNTNLDANHGDGNNPNAHASSLPLTVNESTNPSNAAPVAVGPPSSAASAGNAMQAALASFLFSVAAANANNAMQQTQAQAQAHANAQQQQQQARQADSWPGGFAAPSLAVAPVNAFPIKQQEQQQQQHPQQQSAVSAGSEVAQLRCYHEKQSRINQFLKHFKELPLHLQSDAFKHPPPFIEPPDLLKALISLPLQSQALIIKQLPLSTQKSLIRALTPREKQRLLDTLQGKPVLFDEDPNDEFCSIPNAYIERASMIAMEEGVAPSANAANQPSLSAHLLDEEGEQSVSQNEDKQDVSNLTPVLYSTRLNLFASRKPETLFLPIIQKMMFSFGDVHYVPEEELMQQYNLGSNSALMHQLNQIRQRHQSRQNDSQNPDVASSMLPLTIAWPSLYSAMCIQDYIYQFLSDLIVRLPRKQSLQMLIRFFPLQAGVFFRWKRMNSLSKQEQTSKMKVREEKGDGNMLAALPLERDDDEDEHSNADMDSDDEEVQQQRMARRNTGRRVAGKRKRSGKKTGKSDAPSTDEKSRRGNKKRKIVSAAGGGASDSDAMDEEDESMARGKSLRRRVGRKNADSDASSDSSASASSDSDSSYEESGGGESSDSSSSSDDEHAGNEHNSTHAALMEDAPTGLADPSVLAVAEHAPTEAAAAKTASAAAADGAEDDEAELEEVDEIIARATRNHPTAASKGAASNVTVKKEGGNNETNHDSAPMIIGEEVPITSSTSPHAEMPSRSSATSNLNPTSSSTSSSSDPISADASRVSYEFYLPMLDTYLGPLHRLSNQNAVSQDMSREHFAEFVKAREASFVSPPRRLKSFVSWLKLPPWLTKNVLFLLGFLAWDRIGMIIEICGRLRECSRHARSQLPYTVYEIQKAIRVLDAHPQTSLLFLKDHMFVGAVKEEVNEYISSKRKTARSQQQSHPVPSTSPVAATAPASADQANSVAAPALSSQENEAFQHAQLQQLTESIGLPLGIVPIVPTASVNPTVPAASFLSDSASVAANVGLARSAAALPPTQMLPVPTSMAVNLSLPTIDSLQSGLSPFAKPGRFSDKTRLRLLAMSEACGWKYRRSNPEIQSIHKEEGLGLEQIRSWMNNNKPTTLKKTIKTSVSDKSTKSSASGIAGVNAAAAAVSASGLQF